MLNLAAYLFVHIDDPHALAGHLHEAARAADLKGTILVAGEGINLFLAGPDEALRGFVDGLHADPRLAGLKPRYSRSGTVPFARLKVKVKPEIISFRHPEATPLAQGARAPAVDPATVARWLAQGGRDDQGRPVVMLDTRNAQEVAYGTFQGALTLPITKFTDLPAALEPHRQALADATVVSFCTGGIRCEKAALWMRQDGMDNVLQLEGGILGWFEQVGGQGYEGRCFVFDERVALDPQLRPLVDENFREETLAQVTETV
ncbi:sulfurtransferase [Pseudoxanthomonas suwonensis]|jgi:Predicted sulfurtransferase|uniref:sulfurtransferase n=1 Tax=Pseudoxanthomonas suwonensis TaxID=314722 RepID=UPI00138F00A9|nr:sulfurtransferase [Pseudoxanthomonas suwonensis]KAF1703349.1 sulfurtransferase [Pseudoxanthomonas suwonensis]